MLGAPQLSLSLAAQMHHLHIAKLALFILGVLLLELSNAVETDVTCLRPLAVPCDQCGLNALLEEALVLLVPVKVAIRELLLAASLLVGAVEAKIRDYVHEYGVGRFEFSIGFPAAGALVLLSLPLADALLAEQLVLARCALHGVSVLSKHAATDHTKDLFSQVIEVAVIDQARLQGVRVHL